MNRLQKLGIWLSFFRRVGKRRSPISSATVEISGPWIISEEDRYLEEVEDRIWTRLEKVGVDVRRRKLQWRSGKKKQSLSIGDSVKRLKKIFPDYPIELIESGVLSWLAEASGPENVTEEEMDEYVQLVEDWVEDYQDLSESKEIS